MISPHGFEFENDVEMYGAQTKRYAYKYADGFENDVEMYGAQTLSALKWSSVMFENDVEMYGAQTLTIRFPTLLRLRMM